MEIQICFCWFSKNPKSILSNTSQTVETIMCSLLREWASWTTVVEDLLSLLRGVGGG
jgi:hypothetical protein